LFDAEARIVFDLANREVAKYGAAFLEGRRQR
jgi:hypothetical protein